MRGRLEALLPWRPSDEPERLVGSPATPVEPEPLVRSAVTGTPPSWPVRLWTLTRSHMAAVALVVAIGLLWAAFSLTQARSVPLSQSTPEPTVSVANPTPTASATVIVHVLGAVRSPGVVRLQAGARVHDALSAAGGLRPEARPGELNLAAAVSDGAQIKIGTVAQPTSVVRPPGSGGPGGAAGGANQAGAAVSQAGPGAASGAGTATGAGAAGASALVNLNTATQTDLDTLPGVGPVTAAAILEWRQKHGKFNRIEELQEIDGIGPKTFAQLAPRVCV